MKWYREPLLHFLLAGLALFAVYGGFHASPQRSQALPGRTRRCGMGGASVPASWTRSRGSAKT